MLIFPQDNIEVGKRQPWQLILGAFPQSLSTWIKKKNNRGIVYPLVYLPC